MSPRQQKSEISLIETFYSLKFRSILAHEGQDASTMKVEVVQFNQLHYSNCIKPYEYQ